jgi:hypothetical protein
LPGAVEATGTADPRHADDQRRSSEQKPRSYTVPPYLAT